MSRQLHAVIVNEGVPYPPNAGNRVRTLNLMSRLARRHRITYICRGWAHPEEIAASRQFLEGCGIRMIVADQERPECGRARLLGRLAANLLSPLPYAVASHNSPALREALRDYARRTSVDLWQFEWLAYADAVAGASDAPTIVDAHNVESLIWQRYSQNAADPLRRFYLRGQWRRFERFERRILSQATRVVAVSSEDAELAARRFGARSVSVVENGIDGTFLDAAPAPRDRHTILFLGSLDWRPNLDAIDLLLSGILPRVLQRQPDARLCIVGRRPPSALRRRVEGTRQVSLHADVPDVRPYLAQAGVMVVPLRIGGGSRLKILEALASGLPVISTSIGAEGLGLQHGQHLILADEPMCMAEALAQHIDHPAPLDRMAGRGRRFVRNNYDWDILADRLEGIWLDCVQRHEHCRPERAISHAVAI